MPFSSARQKPHLIGAHFSIAGGLDRALYEADTYRCRALQIFTQNAMTWKARTLSAKEIRLFKQAKAKTGIKKIASHASYLINLAAGDQTKRALSVRGLQLELTRSSMLGIPWVVLHPGFHTGMGEEKGIRLVTDNINAVFSKTPDLQTRLLLETAAGQGSSLGHTFEQLASIIERIDNKNRVGICFDTSHIFAAGYDIRAPRAYRKTIKLVDSTIGLDRLCLIHLNDSKTLLGSRIDRHEHIGQGFIGLKAFELIMNDARFLNIPKIIETPKGNNKKDWDRINLNRLRSLVSG